MDSDTRIRKALQDLVYLPSLKDSSAPKLESAQPVEPICADTPEKKGGICRPWDRTDLRVRLQTYKARNQRYVSSELATELL